LKIVLGLGNPGYAYRSTRHNMGFWVLDRVAKRRGLAFRKTGLLRRYAWVVECGPSQVLLAKPRTFMNRSGRAAAALCRTYGAHPGEMLVVYDDADLELGRLRLRGRGGAGGHNGMRSLIEVLGTEEFPRVRLGVRGEGRGDRDLADYVLDDFHASELPVAEAMADLGADAVEGVIETGLEVAMNRYNGRRAGPADVEAGEETGRAPRGPA
jgi:PTH1 family peptidyl-tRNA hydrolase